MYIYINVNPGILYKYFKLNSELTKPHMFANDRDSD